MKEEMFPLLSIRTHSLCAAAEAVIPVQWNEGSSLHWDVRAAPQSSGSFWSRCTEVCAGRAPGTGSELSADGTGLSVIACPVSELSLLSGLLEDVETIITGSVIVALIQLLL